MTHWPAISGTGTDHLKLVLAIGDIGVWELDTVTGEAWRNRRHDEIFGYSELLAEWSYDRFLDHVVEDDRTAVDELYGGALRNGENWQFECRISRADGQERWISAHGCPLKDESGKTVKLIGHVIDITHTKQREEQLRLVTSELDHRVRNILAVTKAMVALSARTATDVESFAQALEGRLSALSRTHDQLVRHGGRSLLAADIVEAELAAFEKSAMNVEISDADRIMLGGQVAEGFSLIVHELATNALRYGALSAPSGSVRIAVTASGDRRANVLWEERGGPAVPVPGHKGFGSTLLCRALGSAGTVTVDYRESGLRCEIDLPASGAAPSASETRPPEDRSAAPVTKEGIAGKHILVLEDEPLIALNTEMLLEGEGAIIVGPCASVEEALSLLEGRVDAAVLDVNLGQEDSSPVAARLRDAAIPFAFTTGYDQGHELARSFAPAPVLRKPIEEQELVRCLASLLAARRT